MIELSDDRKVIGNRLTAALAERALQAADLARLLGVSQTQVWRVQSGKVKPSLETLQRIVVALSSVKPCSLDDLAAPIVPGDYTETTAEERDFLKAAVRPGDPPEAVKAALRAYRLLNVRASAAQPQPQPQPQPPVPAPAASRPARRKRAGSRR